MQTTRSKQYARIDTTVVSLHPLLLSSVALTRTQNPEEKVSEVIPGGSYHSVDKMLWKADRHTTDSRSRVEEAAVMTSFEVLTKPTTTVSVASTVVNG